MKIIKMTRTRGAPVIRRQSLNPNTSSSYRPPSPPYRPYQAPDDEDEHPIRLSDEELRRLHQWEMAECIADNNMNRALESYASLDGNSDSPEQQQMKRQTILDGLGWTQTDDLINASLAAAREIHGISTRRLDRFQPMGSTALTDDSSDTSAVDCNEEASISSSDSTDDATQTEPIASSSTSLRQNVHQDVQDDDQEEFLEAAVLAAIKQKGLGPISSD